MSISLDRLLADGCSADAKHKVCRSRGGESCAFDGAAIVLMPVADAAHVVHGPISCCSNTWQGRGVHSTAGDFHRRGFSTDMTELDIVYGGRDKLAATVREVVAAERPAAVFVYATCVTGLIGEDLDAVCRELAAELRLPVVPVHAPGFVGPKNLGNRIAGEALVEHVIGTSEPVCTTPNDIALIGEYNVAGDLDLVEPLLAESGIRILSRITGNARFEELRYAHRARLSVTVCSRALVNVAATLRRRYNMPNVEVSFFGPTEISRSLRTIAAALEEASPEAAGVAQRVEQVIARRTAATAQGLAPFRDVLAGRTAVLYSGGVKSWSMVSCLSDLGISVVAVGAKKTSAEDEEKLAAVAPNVPILEDTSPKVLRSLMGGIAGDGADILVAGGRNRYLAAKEGWPFIDVNQERTAAYAGYEGFLNLARDLAHSVRFHERRTTLDCPGPHVPVPVRDESRTGATDPLKQAPSLGAVLATQGVHRALPVIHSAQGCAFLEKVLAIRHFNEPVALATTKLFTEDVVLSSEESAAAAARKAAEASSPDVLALIGAALSEVKGDDIEAAAAALADSAAAVLAVRAPDYEGSLESGWLATVKALVSLAEPQPVREGSIAVFCGSHLTPGDVRTLRSLIEAFALRPIFVPDISVMDGSRLGLSPLAEGGVTLQDLRALGGCKRALVFGDSLLDVGRLLGDRCAVPFTLFDRAHGLRATDRIIAELVVLSGNTPPAWVERDRALLVDAARDAHLAFAGKRIAIALEPDHAASLAVLLDELASPPTQVVIPTPSPQAPHMPTDEVVIGDLSSVASGIDLLISNGYGERAARVRDAVHVGVGFPEPEMFGAARRVTVGYQGGAAFIDRLANALSNQ